MAADPGQVAFISELFAGLGAIRCKAMFGGLGVYADEVFFALADPHGLIYLKGDDLSEETYRREGSAPFTFTYRDGRSEVMRYWRLPDAAYDDPEEALRWGRLALATAWRARAAKPARKARGDAPRASRRSPTRSARP